MPGVFAPSADSATSERVLDAVIVGAGAAGLCCGIKLDEVGHSNWVILEQSDGVGGTWRANTYPGAACDVPSHLYSFSFALKKDWSRKFARQPEILGYFEGIADRFGLRDRIRLGTEVVGATFLEEDGLWEVETAAGETVRARAFISGLGQLNRPHLPDVDGLDSFDGTWFHSARWDHDAEIAGRRVVVVGNGASALQFIPWLAQRASELTVVQRSANWVFPKPDAEFGALRSWVLAHVPGAARWYRWRIYWRLEANFMLLRRRRRLARWIESQVAERLEPLIDERLTRDALIPDYPLGCKRILISNDYYATLKRPNVTVNTSGVTGVTPTGVLTGDGVHHPCDLIVFGTGFRSTEFLSPLTVRGRHGRDLNEEWSRGAHAHLGVTVSGFPNLFLAYGPNTNLGHNSIIFMIEAQARYIADAVDELLSTGVAWIDVRNDVMDRFSDEMARSARRTVWAEDCGSWYKTTDGEITNNWPRFSVSYWRAMRSLRLEEFARSA